MWEVGHTDRRDLSGGYSQGHLRRLAPKAATRLLAVVISSTLCAVAWPSFAAETLRVGAILESLKSGNLDRLTALFNYFEDRVPKGEAEKDKRIVRVFFRLLYETFGYPDRFDAIATTATNFTNVYMESATPDLWRTSDCVFKSYAFRTTFLQGPNRRVADLVLELCLDSRLRPRSVRKVDIRFVGHDTATVEKARGLLQQLRLEIQDSQRRSPPASP